MMGQIDFLATKSQYFDHLLPVYRALPLQWRGDFYLPVTLQEYGQQRGLLQSEVFDSHDLSQHMVRDVRGLLRARDRLLAVCSYGDMQYAYRGRRKGIYFEHGSGQSFGAVNNVAHPGGIGRARESVVLYVVPNDHAAARNLEAYPHVPNVVVGCPKLDYWHMAPVRPHNKKPVICVSFHWDRVTIPETRSAWSYFAPALSLLKLANPQWEIIGHGHPLAMNWYAEQYRHLGIEPVYDFEEVMRRADLYVNDCSSTLYEFASTDRPVVVMNAPWYRRNVDFGLRFWEYADVGVQCDEPKDLMFCINLALRDFPRQRVARHRAVRGVYKYTDGLAAERAARAMVAVAEQLDKPKELGDSFDPGNPVGG